MKAPKGSWLASWIAKLGEHVTDALTKMDGHEWVKDKPMWVRLFAELNFRGGPADADNRRRLNCWRSRSRGGWR